ncbi:hypothetical protein SKAU_G00276860 [Synaphobranchus kaupii]|uniref:Uncharacterized protein n=1 Tax=Synaphobranchus kaupii TaxID=118154 RepID=A0A9Q1IQY5_SYNKA|nr:hypothetical protein SKAU_G00276860 [Synaphobranchus kaupii]
MVQGTEASLGQFELGFQPLKKQAEKHKREPEYKTLEPEPEPISAPASEAPPPAHYTPSSPKVYSSIRTLRDSLAVLEHSSGRTLWLTAAATHSRLTVSRNCPGTAKHVLIHTGTNDLSTRRIDVAKALKQVAAKATQEYPAAKVTISTLLPRTDVPQANHPQHQCRGIPRLCPAAKRSPGSPP